MLTKVTSFEKHLRRNCQTKGGGEEKREAREKASELGAREGSEKRGWEEEMRRGGEREKEREREGERGRQKELRRE